MLIVCFSFKSPALTGSQIDGPWQRAWPEKWGVPVSSLIFMILSTCLRIGSDPFSIPCQVSNSQAAVTKCFLGSSFNLSISFGNCNFFLSITYGFLLDLQNSTVHSMFWGEKSLKTFIWRSECVPEPIVLSRKFDSSHQGMAEGNSSLGFHFFL